MADYDVVFVGAGPGGYVGAIRAAQLGGKVAVVENRQLGGVCLNRGCIPTKMYLHTADLLHEGTHASEYGLNFGKPSIDFPKLNQKRDSIVSTLRKGVAGLFKKNKVEHIQGTAAIEAPGKVRIDTEEGDKTISASNIVIATGSEPARPAVFPFDGKRILTSDEILQLNEIPKSLIIVGGGYIGCEYACFFNRMGTSVTIVEMLDQLLPMMDADIASELSKTFQKAGIKIHTRRKLHRRRQRDESRPGNDSRRTQAQFRHRRCEGTWHRARQKRHRGGRPLPDERRRHLRNRRCHREIHARARGVAHGNGCRSAFTQSATSPASTCWRTWHRTWEWLPLKISWGTHAGWTTAWFLPYSLRDRR